MVDPPPFPLGVAEVVKEVLMAVYLEYLTGVAASCQVGNVTVEIAPTVPTLSLDNLIVKGNMRPPPHRVSLRWSDDAGKSYSNKVEQTLGDIGMLDVDVQFRRLGMARSRVFEISWSMGAPSALCGAFVQANIGET